jgi:predicted O-linked N-acetylglucosamine transferase (SPINDLY family)
VAWVPEEAADKRHYLRLKPDVERHSRLLFMLNYLTDTTPEMVYEESVRWAEMYADPLAKEILRYQNTPDPERRLKVAYISPDLRAHAIMKLLPAIFEKHDANKFEIFAYSVDTTEDAHTVYVREATQNFVDLPLDRKVIAERVRADEIDVLVDLAGHTMRTEAYLAFAAKPAPVQVSWLGALSTTGLKTMDYFVGDRQMPAPGTEHLFTEKVYRLPRAVCTYRPPNSFEVGVSPYFRNGYITFGSFNDPRKITQDAVKVWSILLYLHPRAKLLLKYQLLEREVAQRRIKGWFAEFGVPLERIVFEGRHKAGEYLARYRAIDIALDPFPYNGGTTTLDALWMGVPLVSMRGRLAVSCSGASSLTAVGLPVANSVEEYVELANEYVKAIPKSPDIRQKIREAMQKSELMDEVGLVRELEAAYRQMWRNWCATQTS